MGKEDYTFMDQVPDSTRMAVALERIADHLCPDDLKIRLVEMTRERDEARRERDDYRAEYISATRALGELTPLRWSPEPPKVEGLYMVKSKGDPDSASEASHHTTEEIASLYRRDDWDPTCLWVGPLVIAPFQAPGAGGGE